MRFGVHLNPFWSFAGLDDLVAYVERVESLGYDYVHIPEHTIFGLEQEQRMGAEWWDAVVLATHLAGRTERVRLFFSIIVLPHHHPIRLAKALATLDHISDGRVDVGIGVGWLAEEFDALGVPFSGRGARADEYIDILRTLWTTHPCTHEGELFRFHEMSFHPKPLQRPHPPIWVGGSIRASVGRAAARGDAWVPMGATLDELEAGIGRLHEALRANGRDEATMPIAARVPLWEASAKTTTHALESGASPIHYFNGDLDAADEHIARAAKLGVTHMWVELPLDHGHRLAELDRFAEHAIARRTPTAATN